MNFEVTIELFLTHLKSLNRSDGTIEQYKSELDFFNAFAKKQSIFSPREIEAFHLDLYQSELVKKDNSSTTRAKKASVLRSFFKFLYTRKYISFNPMEVLDPIKVKDVDQKKREVLSMGEIQLMFKQSDKASIPSLKERNRCMLLIFLYCGVRVSELCNLKVNQFDFKNQTLFVHGKGGKIREVPLHSELMKDLKVLIRNKGVNDSVFTKKKSMEQVSPRSILNFIKKIIAKAKIGKNIGCHSLRRTAASMLLKEGVNLRFIQQYLGHSNIGTTMLYLNSDIEEVKDVIRSKHMLSKKLKFEGETSK